MEREQPGAGGTGGPTPERIMQLAFGFAPPEVLASALDLRLLTHIAEGRATLPALVLATRGQ